ncbi:hypothetical protein Btru_046230 [Bulinus truncatus]|nr:hypothetical protein Btru_046230 [Bulinus truncatus]
MDQLLLSMVRVPAGGQTPDSVEQAKLNPSAVVYEYTTPQTEEKKYIVVYDIQGGERVTVDDVNAKAYTLEPITGNTVDQANNYPFVIVSSPRDSIVTFTECTEKPPGPSPTPGSESSPSPPEETTTLPPSVTPSGTATPSAPTPSGTATPSAPTPSSPTTVITTSALTSSSFTTPGLVCENVVEITEKALSSLPILKLATNPQNIEIESFHYFVPSNSRADITLELPLGGKMMSLFVQSESVEYKIFTVNKEGVLSGPVKNNSGSDNFVSSSEDINYFSLEIPPGFSLRMEVYGYSTGFKFNISNWVFCLPKESYCTLETEKVLAAVGYLPLNNILGQTYDNVTVYYGHNGDRLEEGVAVKMYCGVSYCRAYGLTFEATKDCNQCPEANTIECKGDCSSALTSVTFSELGVPSQCQNDSVPCIPAGCTTPTQCPSPWSPWTVCDNNCQQYRTRECPESCGEDCKNFNLTQVQSCSDCIPATTLPICEENEMFACVTKYMKCIESCANHRKNSSCDYLLEDDSCQDGCICAKDKLRNMFGECVEPGECECFETIDSSTPIPQTYIENITKCSYCMCSPSGYVCKEREDCCELGPWSDWSDCTVTCGLGTKQRTRTAIGNGCSDSDKLSETQTCMPRECPCLYNDQVMESGTVIDNHCQECSCDYGKLTCTNKFTLGVDMWPSEDCRETCYCNMNGTMECIYSETLDQCRKEAENCDLTTHVLEETSDPCCKRCVPKMIPCEYKAQGSVQLNVTDNDHGLCVSTKPIEVGSCSGTCGVSTDMIVKTVFQTDRFEVVTASDCKCCKAGLGLKSHEFSCDDGAKLLYDVSFIASCSCELCSCKFLLTLTFFFSL